ncbi:MAG: 3-hydroxyacyl-[acyl-carrier-protein] dehydratase FabA, partial [Deltaproteobacteria bacterium]|nr:3-hydroxyacyl-[acyl-carrier-protein] dehydratase FabA [Deltaproteobacteria bacterium]
MFPGSETPEQFWQNIVDEKDVTSFATEEEFGADPAFFYDPSKGNQDKCYSLRGGFVRDFKFDPDGYNIKPGFLESLDDLFKYSLYVSRQALQDSGYLEDKTALERCGVIFGNLSFPTRATRRLFSPLYTKSLETALQELLQTRDFRLKSLAGAEKFSPLNMTISCLPAAVISQALSLEGPQFSLDAACASSLYAIKLACDYLLGGEADMMLAGAVSCADPLYIHIGFSIFQAYPEEGQKHAPLDRASKGLVSSEGAGALVLKRYEDAVRDGNTVYATICGCGLSNDGRGKFLLVPNPKGQLLAMERAYDSSPINPGDIDFLECHATGTPVGDAAEVSTLDTFFGRNNRSPLIGAVKSNMGHLLTAAGMPGMLKIIFSMSEGVIPPTIHLEEPHTSVNNVITPRQVITTKTPWPEASHIRTSPIRRAGINCFGFGGANAHLIVEQAVQDAERVIPTTSASPALKKMAIVGMDAHFGSCRGLHNFYFSVFNGTRHFIALPQKRWKGLDGHKELLKAYGLPNGEVPHGAYIENFDLDIQRYRIQPKDADKLQPQQTLMLTVADNALKDAGLEARAGTGANVAVIIAMETELSLHQSEGRWDLSWQIKKALLENNISLSASEARELENLCKELIYHTGNESLSPSLFTSFIGNIMAGRISALWDFTGPAFTVSSGENSVYKALELAQMMLTSGEVEAVLVGAVDLAGGPEAVLARNLSNPVNQGTPSLSFNQDTNGWLVGEGAGAVVLTRVDKAAGEGRRIYAVIDDISLIQSKAPINALNRYSSTLTPDTVEDACRKAFEKTRYQVSDIGYLEASASGIFALDEAEMKGLAASYQVDGRGLSCALGSIKANIGHTFAASGIASLIKTALCLYYRFIPGTPGWSSPKMAELWQKTRFYVPVQSRPWILEGGRPKRIAAISGLGSDNTCAHIILSEASQHGQWPHIFLQKSAEMLFPVAGSTPEDLEKGLNA